MTLQLQALSFFAFGSASFSFGSASFFFAFGSASVFPPLKIQQLQYFQPLSTTPQVLLTILLRLNFLSCLLLQMIRQGLLRIQLLQCFQFLLMTLLGLLKTQ